MATPTKEETVAALEAAGFPSEEHPTGDDQRTVLQIREGVKVHLNWRSGVANCFSEIPMPLVPLSDPYPPGTPRPRSAREKVHDEASVVLRGLGWRMQTPGEPWPPKG